MKTGNISEGLAAPAGTAPTSRARGPQPQDGAGQAKGAAPASPTASPESGSSVVKLSSAATALMDGADGGFDAEKVKSVRDAIANGTYKINHEAIADKLISNAQELLGNRSAASAA